MIGRNSKNDLQFESHKTVKLSFKVKGNLQKDTLNLEYQAGNVTSTLKAFDVK